MGRLCSSGTSFLRFTAGSLRMQQSVCYYFVGYRTASATLLLILRRAVSIGRWRSFLNAFRNAQIFRQLIHLGLEKVCDHLQINASIAGDNLVYKRYFNIGFAADTPNGLVVPVIKEADGKGVFEIAKETAALAAKAREGKLAPAEMQGGTFSISSLGGIGGTSFTPIINAPEVAILCVSKSFMKPVWNGTAFAPRLMLPLSLSYDHRVIDGALAARFNAFLTQLLADMRRSVL